MNLVSWCEKVIRWSFYLLFILVPLIVTPWNYELFEFNKMLVVYGLTSVIVCAWLVKSFTLGKLIIARTPLDLPLALFVSSLLISSLFSIDPHVSWFGYYSRFNGGMWSLISYVLLYYAFVSNMHETVRQLDSKTVRNKNTQSTFLSSYSLPVSLLSTILATGIIVAIYGLLERTGHSLSCLLFAGKFDVSCWVQDVQNRVFATMGQPNWLGAYLAVLIPLTMGFGLKSQFTIHNSQRGVKDNYWILDIGYWILSALFFLVLLSTRSRSGLFAFALADLIFWIFVFYAQKARPFQAKPNQNLLLPFIICHLSFAIILFLNGSNISKIDKYFSLSGWTSKITNSASDQTVPTPNQAIIQAPLLEVGGTESGTIRKYVWQGAINAWRGNWKNYFVGTGTETFAFAFYQYRPAGHNLTSEWDFLYNKAHNEYLNYLATTGIFGFGSYLLIIVMFLIWFVKMFNAKCQMLNAKLKILDIGHWTLDIALFSGWISILVTNFFGFSVVVTQLIFFLFPAIIFYLSTSNRKYFLLQLKYPKFNKIFTSLIIIFTIFILYLLAKTWTADKLYATGNRLSKLSQYPQAQNLLSQAIKLNGNEPLYYEEYGTVLSNLAIQALEKNESSSAGQFTRRALDASDKALTISPKNVNFWKSRTKIFYTFAEYDPEFGKAAIAALVQAQTLSPNDPKIYYNLAVLIGQQGDNQKAIDLLLKAKELKPNYRDAYFGLYVFYNEIKQKERAEAQAREYLSLVDPNDKEFLDKLK